MLLFRIFSWIVYRIKAHSVYTVHSPFVYDFWENVLVPAKRKTLDLTHLSTILKSLQNSTQTLPKQELGTGTTTSSEQVARVAKISSIADKYGRVLAHLIQQYQPNIAVELGTCLGISTLYQLKTFSGSHFYTLEGSAFRQEVAKTHLATYPSCICLCGDFETQLNHVLSTHPSVDFVFIDGNHTYDATKRYFELLLPHLNPNSILIFDDIYWSKGMQKAWKEIVAHPAVTMSIDIYQLGICFFHQKSEKQHLQIRY